MRDMYFMPVVVGDLEYRGCVSSTNTNHLSWCLFVSCQWHDSYFFIIKLRQLLLFRWISREIFLEKVERQSLKVLEDLRVITTMGMPLDTPKDYTLQQYMEDIKLEGRKHMFVVLRSKETKMESKGGNKGDGLSELDMAAHRVVYRYVVNSFEGSFFICLCLCC